MSNSLIATLSVNLACQLICAGNRSVDNSLLAVDTPLPRQTVIPDGYTSFPDVGMAYKFFDYTATWDSARKTCIEKGASLAVIDTFKKIEYMMRIKASTAALQIGIHRHFNFSEWISVKTGLPVTISSWAPVNDFANKDHLCGAMWLDGRGIGASPCNNLRHFVCEISLSAN